MKTPSRNRLVFFIDYSSVVVNSFNSLIRTYAKTTANTVRQKGDRHLQRHFMLRQALHERGFA